jgi:hypothetical protein
MQNKYIPKTLDKNVLAVLSIDPQPKQLAAYIGFVDYEFFASHNSIEAILSIAKTGTKLTEKIARAIFPEIEELFPTFRYRL